MPFRRGKSEFYALRRPAIRDAIAALGFLAGFLGAAPFGWDYLQRDTEAYEMVRGLFKMFGVLLAGGIIGGILGVLAGEIIGRIWELLHRLIRSPIPEDDGQLAPAPVETRVERKGPRIKPPVSWSIRYSDEPLDVDAFLALANRVWPKRYDRELAADALSRTRNIAAWKDQQLVGVVRVLTDGYFFATIPEIMVDPDHRVLGIGRELMTRALDSAPRGMVFFGAQPQSVGFFESLGAKRGPVGMVLAKPES